MRHYLEMHFSNAAACYVEIEVPGAGSYKPQAECKSPAPSPQPAEMLAHVKTNNHLQEVLARSLDEVSKERVDGLLNTKEQLRVKHYPALSKGRQMWTSDEETDAVLSTSNSAQSIRIAHVVITQTSISMPA